MQKYKRAVSLILSLVIIHSFSGCSKNTPSYEESTQVVTENQITTEAKEKYSMIIEYEEKQTTKPFVDKDENIYTTSNVNLRKEADKDSEVIDVIDKYTKLELLKTNGSWDYVSFDDVKGYVSSKYTKNLGDTFAEVDISDQLLYLYVDSELVDTIDVTTGMKDKWDTRVGCHSLYSKERNRGLTGEGYKNLHVDYWMPFDGGIGFHDAYWRDDNSFGGDTYKSNGSHGCVSMRKDDVITLYENMKVGDKVLVHK